MWEIRAKPPNLSQLNWNLMLSTRGGDFLDALASFAEGKLKGKKENLISHLAFCNDCLEMIKFLRKKPSEEEVSVPL